MFNPKYDKYGFGATRSDRDRQGVTWDTSMARRIETIAKTHGGKLSDYATKNGDEYMAESFVAYERGGRNRDKIHPAIRDIYDDLSK